MKNTNGKQGTITLVVILMMLLLSVNCFAQFAGGRGTAEDPWQVESLEHLLNVREYLTEEHADKHFVQTANIDLDVEPWNEGEGWMPIGSYGQGLFHGTYDGGRFHIANLMINRELEHQALFGVVRAATIRNVGLINADISGGHIVAGIVGKMYSAEQGRIERCYVDGTITGHDFVAGIVGTVHEGRVWIEDCYSTAVIRVHEPHCAGGIVAEAEEGTLSRCYSIGAIEAEHIPETMGAIAGVLHGFEVMNVYFSEELTGMREGVGVRPGEFPGNSTEEMMQRETFEGFNFDEVWNISENTSFPFLQWQGEEPDQHNLPPLMPPSNLRATAGDRVINLNWTAPPADVGRPDGYNVYRGEERINEEPVAETGFQDTQLSNFTGYSYTVTAVYDELESMPSNSVTAVPYSFPGGNGTEANPYHISNAEELNGIRFFDYYFIQTENIDLDEAPWNEGEGWLPIGINPNNSFSGSYDGANYHITGLTINRPNTAYQALFGAFSGDIIQRVGLRDVDITGSMMVAGLVGNVHGASTVRQSYVSGNIESTGGLSYVGGLVAYQSGQGSSIYDCYTNVNIVTRGTLGHQFAGGVISYLFNGDARRCYAAGSVATAVETTNGGAVIGNVRTEHATFDQFYWNTDTALLETGVGNVPGVAGFSTVQLMMQDVYQGFDFDQVWNIENGASFPFLGWEGDEPQDHNRPPLLPPQNLTGMGGDTIVNLSWNEPPDIIGRPDGYYVYRNDERVNEEPVQETNYQDTGLNNWQNYNYYVTAVYEGRESMPSNRIAVITVAFAGGNGTPQSPYLVETEEQLSAVRLRLDANYRQIDDIFIAAETWVPIGDFADNNIQNTFRGTYDGNGHTITGISIIGGERIGLFGTITNGAVLRNIGLEEVNLRDAGFYSGTLVGVASNSTVTNCYAIGNMTAENRSGALIGVAQGSQITDCWTSVEFTTTIGPSGGLIGTVSHNTVVTRCISRGSTISTQAATQDIGGLIGWVNSGVISNSYSRSRVTTHQTASNVGGLIGRNQGTVSNTFALGRIVSGDNSVGGLIGNNTGNVTGSYWNTDTTEREDSDGGEARNTEQMMYPYEGDNTYINWDFDNIWFHDENRQYNSGYPALRNQFEGLEPLDRPEVVINAERIFDVDRVFLNWEAVEGANSYRIYVSDDPLSVNWGQPVAIIAETEYSEEVADRRVRFYYVVASSAEVP